MQINLKEAWIMLNLVYTDGSEQWTFHTSKPDSLEDTFDAKTGKHVPGTMKRIWYVESDDA